LLKQNSAGGPPSVYSDNVMRAEHYTKPEPTTFNNIEQDESFPIGGGGGVNQLYDLTNFFIDVLKEDCCELRADGCYQMDEPTEKEDEPNSNELTGGTNDSPQEGSQPKEAIVDPQL